MLENLVSEAQKMNYTFPRSFDLPNNPCVKDIDFTLPSIEPCRSRVRPSDFSYCHSQRQILRGKFISRYLCLICVIWVFYNAKLGLTRRTLILNFFVIFVLTMQRNPLLYKIKKGYHEKYLFKCLPRLHLYARE